MLSFILLFLLISLVFLVICQKDNLLLKDIGFVVSSFIFFLSFSFLLFFDTQIHIFQFKESWSFIFNPFFNYKIFFGLDHLSLLFFILTTFLIFLSVIYLVYEFEKEKLFIYLFFLFLLEFFLILIFFSLDLFFFYVAFESSIIPMFFLVGIFGSRERKVLALYLLIFYTICGSLLMLLSILYLYWFFGTLNFEILLATISCDSIIEKIIWLCFSLSFLSKIPIFPFHIWLPEAHVEAPTVGSVILAGILLKLGVYGLIRFNLCLFPISSFFFSPYLLVFCALGVIYSSLCAICQSDIKRIIAYSSIAHMNLVVIGIFCNGSVGLAGAIFQSISHGFVSSGLFFLVGFLYSRYHSRAVQYYKGLVQLMPIYAFFFLFFSLANLALPSTSAFIGEFLIFLDCFRYNEFLAIAIVCSIVICALYSLWLANRILFGNLTSFTSAIKDLYFYEIFIAFNLFFFILVLGIFPFILLDFISVSVNSIWLHYF